MHESSRSRMRQHQHLARMQRLHAWRAGQRRLHGVHSRLRHVIGVELPAPLKVFACPGLAAGGAGSTLLNPAAICSRVNAPLFVLSQAVNQESNPDSISLRVSVPISVRIQSGKQRLSDSPPARPLRP